MADQVAVALVTGASRGIGRATALGLAGAGFDVVVTARTLREGEGIDDSDERCAGLPLPGSIEKTAKEVRHTGRRALGIRLDMLDRTSIDHAVARVLHEWGQIDVLVNNAMYLP